MLRIDISGDTHPKTFKLVTDDMDGELSRLSDLLDEVSAGPDDEIRKLLHEHSVEDFEAGVEIPTSEVGPLGELLEGDWPEEADKIYAQAEDALDQAEKAADLGDH